MTKPIGYYIGYKPGDEGLLAEMEESFGSQFQSLNNSQRLWMLMTLAETFGEDETEVNNEHDEDVQNSIERFEELSKGQRIGLMEALVAQIKYFGSY